MRLTSKEAVARDRGSRCISLASCHVASRIPHGGHEDKTQSVFLGYRTRDRAWLSYWPLFIFAEEMTLLLKRALSPTIAL